MSRRALLCAPAAALALAAFALIAFGLGASAATAAAPTVAAANAPVLLPVANDPTVSIKIAFRIGSQNDPAGREGLTALTAAMMAEGATHSHTYPEILRLLMPMATSYSVRVDKELVTFSGRVHKDNLDAFTALMLDAILHPALGAEDFARLEARTHDGIEKNLRYASDEELGKQTLQVTVFDGTPYGHLNAGTLAGLDAITLDDVQGYYRTHFTRGAVVLAVGGGFDGALVTRLRKALDALPAGPPEAVAAPQLEPIAGRQVVVVKKTAAATAVSFGFPIAARRGEREFYALWLANSWLGEHRNSSSHLYQVIRGARGMNYGDYSYIEWFPEGGQRQMPPSNAPRRRQLFEVWIRPVPNGQAHFALRAAMREVERLAHDGLTPSQFEETRTFLTKYCLHFAPSTDDRLGYALDDRLYGVRTPGDLENFRTIVPTLTLAEVNAAVKKYLRPENLVIAIVSGQADSLAQELAADTPSPMTYANPKPEAVLAEDKQIQAYPLRLSRDAIRVVPVEELFAR